MREANYNCCFGAMLCLERLMELPELPDPDLAEETRQRAYAEFVDPGSANGVAS